MDGAAHWARELTQAARRLVRQPAFSVVSILTLALAIGANTAIFSVVDSVLLDPLGFDEPDELVAILGTAPGSDLPEEFGVGTEFYVQYRENAGALADLGLYDEAQTTVRTIEEVERLFISTASPSLFSTLRVGPVLGRLPANDDPEGEVVVISHWLWTSWFGADPEVLGEPIEVSGNQMTILGVMGPDFRFPAERTSLWVHDLPTEPIRPGGFGLGLVGRLSPGADHETLSAELHTLAQRLPERFGGPPQYARIIEQHRPIVRSLEEQLIGDFDAPLWILFGTVGIVLLIACANVANLLIVRAESRRLDLAVRGALGAGRPGLIRAQMSEALILAGAGGLGGLVLARFGVPLLVAAAPEGIPGLEAVTLDPTALLFTGGVATLAALGSGLLPALRFSNPDALGGLRSSTRGGSAVDRMTRNGLVVVQTAAALVLLVGSGLLLQSFRSLNRVDPGFETENIFTFQMAPDGGEHGLVDGPTYAQFHYSFLDRLAALGGIESVGLVNTLPLDEGAGLNQVETPQTDPSAGIDPQIIGVTFVGGDYFQTMGIELLAGEYFERDPNPRAQVNAIVSPAAAELLWPGQEAIGQTFRPAGSQMDWLTVSGIVEDIFLDDFRQASPDPMIYLPMVGTSARSWAVGTPAYVVKTPRAAVIAPEIRELIDEIASEAPMYRVFTLEELAARSMAQLSFTMLTLGVAAVLALILGAVGIYGTLSYVVTQRTREIGIRMALGAQAGQVRRMIVTQGGTVTLIGVAIGLVGAVGATRVLDALLFGVEAIDPVTFVGMSALLVGVSLLASYQPARRASAVDPMRSLQLE